jgi:UDP-N-acetyl-D-mannosaminuronic acid dehydrogenase
MKKVCVLGLGYIGLPTAGILATNGYEVLGIDVSQEVVDTVNEGNIHIEEPGLHTLVSAAIGSGNLRAATSPEPADVFIVAVPTPLTDDKGANMAYVERATQSIVPVLQAEALIILESTSPPGTCRDLMKPILEQSGLKVGQDIFLAHCPERVLPGKILKELISNDRVIGGYDPDSAERARELYATVVEGKLFLTDATTAEMVKILENTFRDVNIALANETALICEDLGIDFKEVARFANRHPRVNVHDAGPGVGGHCIPVDPWFVVEKHPEESRMIRLARERNDDMPRHVATRCRELVVGIDQPRIAVLGVAYKGNVDDIRESPALAIIDMLKKDGLDVRVHDPHVRSASIALCDLESAVRDADCILLLTPHDEFSKMDPQITAHAMRNPIVYDTRGIVDQHAWGEAGFKISRLGAG